MRRRSIEENQTVMPACTAYEDGLSKTEEQLLRRNLYGPNGGAVDSPSLNRLFKSTLELGYPQPGEPVSVIVKFLYTSCILISSPALDRSIREAQERGTDIERCCNGLPSNLRMPSADIGSDIQSSTSYDDMASASEIGTSYSIERCCVSLPTNLQMSGVDIGPDHSSSMSHNAGSGAPWIGLSYLSAESNLRMPSAGIGPGPSSSSSHNHGAGGSGVVVSCEGAEPSGVQCSSANDANASSDSVLSELNIKLGYDMVDPPVLNPSNLSATSTEELPKLESIKDSETFLAPKESSASLREPRDDMPPDI